MGPPPLLIWSVKLGRLSPAQLGRSLHKDLFRLHFPISPDPVASLGALSQGLQSVSTTDNCEVRYDEESCQTGSHSSQ